VSANQPAIRTYWPRLREVGLFGMVGIANTIVDFAVLNLLILITHEHKGLWVFGFSALSFFAGVVNSYVLNAYVTFRYHKAGNVWNPSRVVRFIAVNAVGLLLNAGIMWLITPVFSNLYSPMLAINLGKVFATLVSLCWNYCVMKLWIFAVKEQVEQLVEADQYVSAERSVTPIP
jgi:putative flippase GtrA